MATKAAVEALLKDRKLDRTLTSVGPLQTEGSAVPFAVEALDRVLNGGLPRGQVSEIVGPVSSGRTTLAWAALAAATSRGEHVALVDTFDRFDPELGAGCGMVLSHLLWIRGQAISKTAGAVDPAWMPGVRAVTGPGTLLERTIDRALKALNLVVQSGVCTLVVLDCIDVPPVGLARIPASTWLRMQRVIEGSDRAVLLLGSQPIGRSPGGWALQTGAGPAPPGTPATSVAQARWAGTHDRSRRLTGITTTVRAMSPRQVQTRRCELALG